jgi:hypothetical protein
MKPANAGQSFTDVIVVIHGIGSQQRFDTVRSVATRLAGSKKMMTGCNGVPVAPQPLGYFHSDVQGITSIRLIDDADKLTGTDLAKIGVAEVFWADIPQEAQQEGRTMEETKAWARTVVARAQALCAKAKGKDASAITPPDFHLAAEVLDEMIDTIYVLENLTFLADKAGVFSFDLRQTLENYLGDVQIVTEFTEFRENIIGRFRQAMESICKQCLCENADLRLHIVAHSEGTVVSFLGLVQAMSGQNPSSVSYIGESVGATEARVIPDWLKHVHGYMTIGSPIDKHLLLWPRLWEGLNPAFANTQLKAGQIRWRNYYDFGDPVGFKLNTARDWLHIKQSKAFQFCGCPKCQHDIGFARYLFPGKAHTDYWDDADVFEHFIGDVIKPGTAPAKRPASKRKIALLSPLIPYVISFLVLFAGVFILYKNVTRFTHPERDALEEVFIIQNLGLTPSKSISGWGLFQHTFAIAVLIAGTTALARLPRLAVGLVWKLSGLAAFLIGCLTYIYGVERSSRMEIGAAFDFDWIHPNGPTAGVLALSFVVGITALALARSGNHRREERQQWLIRRGMRPLLLCGVIAISAIVGSQAFPHIFRRRVPLTENETAILTKRQIEVLNSARLTRKQLDLLLANDSGRLERLKIIEQAEALMTMSPPVWPVLLATAGFLYLWWLGALLFDMAFIWQRYVRGSVTNLNLRAWASRGYLPSQRPSKDEPCRNPDLSNTAVL